MPRGTESLTFLISGELPAPSLFLVCGVAAPDGAAVLAEELPGLLNETELDLDETTDGDRGALAAPTARRVGAMIIFGHCLGVSTGANGIRQECDPVMKIRHGIQKHRSKQSTFVHK